MALVVGAAFGPTITHVEVRDADSGALRSSASATHAAMGPDGDDPTSWWRSLVSAVTQTGEREIAALSVCGSHPGLVLLDGAGAVLRPMQPWGAADTGDHVQRLRQAFSADRWAARAGLLPEATTAVTRLSWLSRDDRRTFDRIGAALLPHDWLTYRLCGRVVTDRGGASLTGAWSPAAEGWLPEVLREIAPGGSREWWQQRLPVVLGPSDRADWLDAPMFDLLGLRGRPLVAPGTGMAMACALAFGLSPARAGIALDTSSYALVGLSEPITDSNGEVGSHADASGGHLAVVRSPGGAALLDNLRRLLDVSGGELSELAQSVDDASSLMLLPDAGGLGSALTGLDAGFDRARLARAAYDGIACGALDDLDRALAAGAEWDDDEPLRFAMGGSEITAHAQVLADLSGRLVQPFPGGSIAAAGACIQAAAVLADANPLEVAEEWDLGSSEWIEPSIGVTARAESLREAHRAARRLVTHAQPSAPPARRAAMRPSS